MALEDAHGATHRCPFPSCTHSVAGFVFDRTEIVKQLSELEQQYPNCPKCDTGGLW